MEVDDVTCALSTGIPPCRHQTAYVEVYVMRLLAVNKFYATYNRYLTLP